MSLDIDISDFQSALEFVEQATGRPMAQSLNRQGGNIVFRFGANSVMRTTPTAEKAKIMAVDPKEVAGYVIKKMKAKGLPITRQSIADAVKKEYARRVRASGYTAFVGWSNAAKAFGGRGVKGVTGSQKKLARFGYGHRASPDNLVAEIANTAPAAEEIGFDALQTAVDFAADDLMVYGLIQLQKQAFDPVNA